MSIGQAVKLCREATGSTQREAAKRLGISNVHLCNIERGHSSLTRGMAARMQRFWGANPMIVAWLRNPPKHDRVPSTERFRRAYFYRHGIQVD